MRGEVCQGREMNFTTRLLLASALLSLPLAGCPGTTAPDAGRDAGRDAFVALDVDIATADAPVAATTDAPTSGTVDAGTDAAASVFDAWSPSNPDAPMVSVSCGGRGGRLCPRGEFCNIPPANMCGRADGPGVCAPIPELCTREFNPQCGCDGMTYSNPCVAARASVSIDYPGTCRSASMGSCDASRVTCDTVPPRCRIGQAPSVVGSCWGPCVRANTCTCAADEECPSIPGYSELCYRSGLCGPAL